MRAWDPMGKARGKEERVGKGGKNCGVYVRGRRIGDIAPERKISEKKKKRGRRKMSEAKKILQRTGSRPTNGTPAKGIAKKNHARVAEEETLPAPSLILATKRDKMDSSRNCIF